MPIGFQQFVAQLEEVAVEVGYTMIDTVVLFQPRFEIAETLLAYIGRVAEYDIKTALIQNFREGGFPTEAVFTVWCGCFQCQAVSGEQVGIEAGEWFANLGSLEPEGEFADLNRFWIDIDPEQVVVEDLFVEVEDRVLPCQFGQFVVGPLVGGVEVVEGGDEKGTGATGGIYDFEGAELLLPCVPETQFDLFAALPLDGTIFPEFAVVGQQLLKTGVDLATKGLFDDEGGDVVGGVDHAMLFAFSADGTAGGGGFGCEVAAADLLGECLQIGNGLFEDVAQYGDGDFGVKVVFGQFIDLVAGGIIDDELVNLGVGGE